MTQFKPFIYAEVDGEKRLVRKSDESPYEYSIDEAIEQLKSLTQFMEVMKTQGFTHAISSHKVQPIAGPGSSTTTVSISWVK